MFMPSREQMLPQLCSPPMEGNCWLKPNNNNNNSNVEIAPNCPRCASSNTKFCYYNNYSFSQPRFFCKVCRRYWTKGGSLRNVPVGGGCRKNRRSRSSAKPLYNKTISSGSSSNNSPLDGTNNSGPDRIDLAEVFSKFLNPDSCNKQADSCTVSMDVNSGQENIFVEESHTFEELSPAFESEKNRVEEEQGSREFSNVITSRFGWPCEDQLVVQEEGGLSLWCDDVGPVSPWNSSPMWPRMAHLQDPETMHIDSDQWAITNCFDTPGYEIFSTIP